MKNSNSFLKILKPNLHRVDKIPLKQDQPQPYTDGVICGGSWLDSCDVVVPIQHLPFRRGLPHEENHIEIQEENSLERVA
jgi:hypothetical protein